MNEQRCCVVSLGINSPPPINHLQVLFQDFPRGLERIRKKLDKYHFKGAFIAWDKQYPEGSSTHQQVPYAFKPFCFAKAHKRGHHLILWMDASIVIKQPSDRFFELIKGDRYLFFSGGSFLRY